jgi:hypothetical protein
VVREGKLTVPTEHGFERKGGRDVLELSTARLVAAATSVGSRVRRPTASHSSRRDSPSAPLIESRPTHEGDEAPLVVREGKLTVPTEHGFERKGGRARGGSDERGLASETADGVALEQARLAFSSLDNRSIDGREHRVETDPRG